MKYTAKKGAVAAGDELTAQAAYEILKAGGNAFDGALAATLMSFVASSSITSLGGGGFMLARTDGGKVHFLDFFAQTPLKKKREDRIEFFPIIVDFGDKSQEFHVGMGTAATPGNLAGIFRIHEQFGSLPFYEVAAPAIEAARNGIHLHKQTKYQADILKPIFELSEEGKQIYYQGDHIKSVGDLVKLPRYADFLEFVSHEGPREFYEGEIARRIDEDCSFRGGHLTKEDFKQYRVIERPPLQFKYRDFDIFTTSPPNAGGPLIAFTLSLLNRYSFREITWGSKDHLTLLTSCIEATTQARKQILEEGIYQNHVLDQLLEPAFINQQFQNINRRISKPGNTTHVSVSDDALNLVSITTSVGEGCGYYIPDTHIMLNNMLGEEDLNPGGFHQWKVNQRISSMMSPTLVMKENYPVAAMGSGGSNRIRSAIVQAISNYIDFKLDPDECVNAPRIHWERNHLDVEPGYDLDMIDLLSLPPGAEKIYWTAPNMYFGGVHAVFIDSVGNAMPAGDRRRVGAVRSLS